MTYHWPLIWEPTRPIDQLKDRNWLTDARDARAGMRLVAHINNEIREWKITDARLSYCVLENSQRVDYETINAVRWMVIE